MPTWDDLRRPLERDTVRESGDVARFAELCAVVFAGGPGKELMEMIRARHVERRVPPGASEAVLREAEAVRGFIFELERARERGLEMLANAKAKTT
jgi:hypothetical protein